MSLPEPDWALWRSFSAVVAEGSLSAAARAIGYSQPTLGRHIETLEQQLNVTLFDRTLQGLRPTPTALRLYEEVGKAQIALSNAVMVAEGTAGDLEGTVRITASTIVSHYLLPPILHDIRDRHPRIALDLVPTDSIENLLLRESDIAVRMMRPTQLELVARKIGDLPIVCCAHQSYIDEHGAPQRPEDLLKHTLIGFDRSELLINGARALGFEIKRSDFAVRTDSQTAYWEMLKTGIGIGFAQLGLVRAASGMREILHGLRPPPLEAWLATHRELFLSPRIRAIYDRLALGLEAHIKGLPA